MSATMLDETHQRELVERARQGDWDAFEAIFRTLRDRLLATIRGRMSPGLRQHIDPEDVLQDTFVRAFHSLERFEWRGEESLRRWLESIATHVALDAARRQGRRKVIQIQRDIASSDPSPSRGMRRKERLERLEESMKDLSRGYQNVLRLARMEGLPLKEIARRMGRSESAVKNLLLRATKQLRQSFGDTESLNLGDARVEDGLADGDDRDSTGGADGR